MRVTNPVVAGAVERVRGCRVETDADGDWHFFRGEVGERSGEDVEVFGDIAPLEA